MFQLQQGAVAGPSWYLSAGKWRRRDEGFSRPVVSGAELRPSCRLARVRREVTLEHVCERLIIWGTPEKVADDLLAFREETGDFGTLLYAGKDWADYELGRRSMILLAEKVKPMVNTAIAATTRAAE